MNLSDWEKSQKIKLPDREAVSCKTCKCEWFEQVLAMKVNMHTVSALGQKVPEDNGMANPQYVLRCMRCNTLQELPLNISGSHPQMQKDYLSMVNDLSKPVEKIESTVGSKTEGV